MGFTAALLTTSSFFPQLLKTWRTGGQDLSYPMLGLFLSGVLLWLLYGIVLQSWPIILANGATAIQVFAILVLKYRNRSVSES